jgi:hypothetical protein
VIFPVVFRLFNVFHLGSSSVPGLPPIFVVVIVSLLRCFRFCCSLAIFHVSSRHDARIFLKLLHAASCLFLLSLLFIFISRFSCCSQCCFIPTCRAIVMRLLFYCCLCMHAAFCGWCAPPSGVLLPVFSLKWYAVTFWFSVSDCPDGQSRSQCAPPASSDTSSFT